MTALESAAPHTGIYGGTFNPIHLGHLRAAQEVLELLGLERVVFVPSAAPPHKPQGCGQHTIAPPMERLAWVELATAPNPRFEVDAVEVERQGPSYTVETLRDRAKHADGERPVFIIGRDAFVELGSWREPETLITLAHFAVTTRPPVGSERLADWLPECLRGDIELAPAGRSGRHRNAGTWIRQLEITALDISASAIRERIRARRSIRYLVPECARESIESSHCYAPEATA